MYNRNIIAILAGLLACLTTARAQYADTFNITVADKTPEHPHYGEGYSKGYLVNGVQGGTITLVRDSLYLFDTHEVPQSLVLLLYTKPIGGGDGIYRDIVKEEYVSQGIRILKATDETPDTLYYASERQPWMGGMILIVDSITTSVEENAGRQSESMLAGAEAYPNPCAGETELRFVLQGRAAVHVQVVDPLGKIVQTVEAGTLEAGVARVRLGAEDLQPGVYLYRIEALSDTRRGVATGKVQVVR